MFFGDGRSAEARRFRDLFRGHCDDLGGQEVMTDAQMSLARCAASMAVELEKRESVQIKDGDYDGAEYAVIAGTLGRTLSRLYARTNKSVGRIFESSEFLLKAARDRGLGINGMRIFLFMISTDEGDGVNATTQEIGRVLGLSTKAIHRGFVEVRNAGYVVRESRSRYRITVELKRLAKEFV